VVAFAAGIERKRGVPTMTERETIERTTVTKEPVERKETTIVTPDATRREDEEADGAVAGGVGGAAIGAVAGGPVGAVVGGAIGAAAGATAGAIDEATDDDTEHEVVVEHRETR
jgi:outer membrane lipoprotein SlyB